MNDKEKRLNDLVVSFDNENGFVNVDYLKNVLPTSITIKKAYLDYQFFVECSDYRKMDGLYTHSEADYLIYSVLDPLAQIGLCDLDAMQSKAENTKHKKDLLIYVKQVTDKEIKLVNKYANKLVIEGNQKLIGNVIAPKEDKNNIYTTLFLDDYLERKNHPNKEVYNLLLNFKKQYEQIEKA